VAEAGVGLSLLVGSPVSTATTRQTGAVASRLRQPGYVQSRTEAFSAVACFRDSRSAAESQGLLEAVVACRFGSATGILAKAVSASLRRFGRWSVGRGPRACSAHSMAVYGSPFVRRQAEDDQCAHSQASHRPVGRDPGRYSTCSMAARGDPVARRRGEAEEHSRFAGPVSGLPADGQRVFEVLGCLL